MVEFLSRMPVEQELHEVLESLSQGLAVERKHVDLKEEAGLHRHDGARQPSDPHNANAAIKLAEAAACMSNTEGGGALIVGVEDRAGRLLGTELDAEWLRHRIYERTGRKVTAQVDVIGMQGARLLVLRVPQSFEPVPVKGKYSWRVDTNCVEVDAATIIASRQHLDLLDWSAQPSGSSLDAARPAAMEIARDYLRRHDTDASRSLADASDADLLRRLRVADASGSLNRAGELLFAGRSEPMLDYIHRGAPGERASDRMRTAGLSMLETLREVDTIIRLATRTSTSVLSGLVRVDLPRLPAPAVREAIVNGLAHRDWLSPEPTVVEHVGDEVIVQSPGGFVGGVSDANIITHPSVTRNRRLADALTKLHVAEREGIGVDIIVREFVRLGRPAPSISQVDGPIVRVAMFGGSPDLEWWSFLDSLEPTSTHGGGLDLLLVLDGCARRLWVDAEALSPTLQRSAAETAAVLQRIVADVSIDGQPVLRRVESVPDDMPPAFTLSQAARDQLGERMRSTLATGSRAGHVRRWVSHRGRVSRAELEELFGVRGSSVARVLQELVDEGAIAPSHPSGKGRGLHYRSASKTSG